jgi:chemotaxis protein MotB
MANHAVIIKKVKKGGHAAHHGGAWKVAYADFVTAMMAFFLLLWLLNVTTDVQKKGIADYFAPASLSRSESGAGGILGGQTLIDQGNRVSSSGVPTVVVAITPPPGRKSEETQKEPDEADIKKGAEKILGEREQKAFKEAEQALHQAIDDVPELADLKRHLIVDMTPEGLRIQIVDQQNQSMFPTGSSQMTDRTKLLLQKIAQVVNKLPNKVSITGHTDATPYRTETGYGNWELSSDRANASRRALLDSGLKTERITQVVGKAEQDPLFPKDVFNASNRRISIVLLRDAPPVASNSGGASPAAAPASTAPILPPDQASGPPK